MESQGGHDYKNARHPINQKVGIVVPDGERFTLLRKAWEMLLTEAYTPVQIADVLNNQWGFRTRQTVERGGNPLSRSYAYVLFRNPFYAGFVTSKGKIIPGLHDPMVTTDEFQRVQQILDAQAGKAVEPVAKQRVIRKPSFAYSGLMRCGLCGCQIVGERHTLRNGSPYVFYRCSNSNGICTQKGVSEPKIETEVMQRLESLHLDEDLCVHTRDDILRSIENNSLAAETIYQKRQETLLNIERQLTNLALMWAKGMLTDEARYQAIERDLENQKASLLLQTGDNRQVLDRMRQNAISACHFLGFARDNFIGHDAIKKREIAYALCEGYQFYGAERRLEMSVHPLLLEVVRYAKSKVQPERAKSTVIKSAPVAWFKGTVSQGSSRFVAFEPVKIGSGSTKETAPSGVVSFGRTEETVIEPCAEANVAYSDLAGLLRNSVFVWKRKCDEEVSPTVRTTVALQCIFPAI